LKSVTEVEDAEELEVMNDALVKSQVKVMEQASSGARGAFDEVSQCIY